MEALETKLGDGRYRVLSLDGGGAKGFYTLGVLHHVEAMVRRPLHECFDLIFGTSTGAIIAALLALGKNVEEIHQLYREHVPTIMKRKLPWSKSKALAELSQEVFGDAKFDAVKTDVGIVAIKWRIERPMIFKSSLRQAHGRKDTFVPGFGVTIGDAVQASASAFPFFCRKVVETAGSGRIELVDGGYGANNPALYAIADATVAIKAPPQDVRVLSIGVGEYPTPKKSIIRPAWWLNRLPTVRLLQKVMEINTQSMDQLRTILFRQILTVRVSEAFTSPEMATDMFEHDLGKLDLLRQRGTESFGKQEDALRTLLL